MLTQDEQKNLDRLHGKDERAKQIRIFALTLLEQCKGENLTMLELDCVLNLIKARAAETTLRDGLTL